jgi:hypothetical protein
MGKVNTLTLAFLVIGSLFLAGGLLVEITDNAPGLLLVYGAVTSFILAFAHRWREPRKFFLLLGLSFLSFIVFAVLHNVFYAIGESSNVSWVTSLMDVLHVGSFLVAVLICPPGILVGLIGYFITGFRARRSHAQARPFDGLA